MESLGLADMDKAINDLKGEVGTVKTSVNGMDSKIINLGNAYQRTLSDYQNNVNSKITQISSGIDLKVTQAINSLDGAALVSRINLSPAGTRIDGKLLHVTGAALFDNNIITKGMLQAGSVTADKMQVDNLSTITANIGDLKGGTITGGTFKNANGSFKIDPNGNIIGANITASRIDASSIFQSGYKIRNIDIQLYKVKHGDWCPIPNGFTEEQCTFVPVGYIQTESYCRANNGSPYIPRATDDGLQSVGERISFDRFNQQKRRWIGWCDIYFRANRSKKVNIGIKGKRQAIAESRYLDMSTSGSDGSVQGFKDVECYSYGELFILVIAKQ